MKMKRKLVLTLLALSLVFGSFGAIVHADTVTVPKNEEELYEVIKKVHGFLGQEGEGDVRAALVELIWWYDGTDSDQSTREDALLLISLQDVYDGSDPSFIQLENALDELVSHHGSYGFQGLSIVQEDVFDVLTALSKLNDIDIESATMVDLLDIKILISDVLDNLKGAGISAQVLDAAIDALEAAFTDYLDSLFTPPTTPTQPGPVVTPPTEGEVDEIIDETGSELDDLLQGIPPTANEFEAAELAKNAVADAIKKASKLKVLSGATYSGGVSQYVIDVPDIGEKLEAISENAGRLNNLLQKTVPNAKPVPVVVTLDIGNTVTDTAQIVLPEDLVSKAGEAGIDAIAVQVNGITIQIDLADLAGESTLTIAKVEGEVDLPAASAVYQFSFESATAENRFSKPVTVSIPVSAEGVDTDLLVLARIVDGELELHGGMYDEASGTLQAKRNSFSSYVVVENKVSFADIDSVQSWAGRQIEVVAAKGIIEGRVSGDFDPNANITRAEFAKLIVKTFALENEQATESFTDVNDSDWFQPYVAAAVEAGIINGRSATIFDPHANITRAEMATMAARALINALDYSDISDVEAALASFVDADDILSTLRSGVALSSTHGVVIGVGEDKFNPNGNSTRAQAAVLIYRLLNK